MQALEESIQFHCGLLPARPAPLFHLGLTALVSLLSCTTNIYVHASSLAICSRTFHISGSVLRQYVMSRRRDMAKYSRWCFVILKGYIQSRRRGRQAFSSWAASDRITLQTLWGHVGVSVKMMTSAMGRGKTALRGSSRGRLWSELIKSTKSGWNSWFNTRETNEGNSTFIWKLGGAFLANH